jgi:hypothetical protein
MNKSFFNPIYFVSAKMIVVALSLFLLQGDVEAQGRWTASVKIANQVDAFPYSLGQLAKIHTPLQPAFTLDVQRNYVNNSRSRFYQGIYGTYFYQPYADKSLTLGTALGYEFRIFKGLYVGVNLGGGINRVKPNDIVYNYENNKWVAARSDSPTSVGGQIQGGGELGYRVGKFSFFAHGQYSFVLKYIALPEESFPYVFKNAGVGVRMGF